MEIIQGLENINKEYDKVCLALGTFDGIHFGHKQVIESAVKKAREMGGTSIVFTFSPHPIKIISPASGPKLISDRDEKVEILKEIGVDVLIFANFTVEFSDLHPEEFIKNILKKDLNVIELFVGFNYTFGKGAIGDTKYLMDMGKKYDIDIHVIPPVKIDDKIVSSSLIRKIIQRGNMEEAAKLLGYTFKVKGKVIEGKRYGRQLGFPTANLKMSNKILPFHGVYGVKVILNDGKEKYWGIMNIGDNPTLKPGEKSIEAYIFDFDRNIYGENICIEIIKFIRAEERYDNVVDLIDQIEEDVRFWENKIKKLTL